MLPADWPACDMPIARDCPPPLTVTVPLRLVVPVFEVTLTVKLPLLVPLVGAALIQLWSSVTVHATFAVTPTPEEEAVAPNDSEVGETERFVVPPPQVLSTSAASRRPFPEPAVLRAIHLETSGA